MIHRRDPLWTTFARKCSMASNFQTFFWTRFSTLSFSGWENPFSANLFTQRTILSDTDAPPGKGSSIVITGLFFAGDGDDAFPGFSL
jgi:hypothetical protein